VSFVIQPLMLYSFTTRRSSDLGQGVQGYAKRYGATYADVFGATFLGGALLPSLLKQDPRYFYKGTGSKPSRILYAISNSVICKRSEENTSELKSRSDFLFRHLL